MIPKLRFFSLVHACYYISEPVFIKSNFGLVFVCTGIKRCIKQSLSREYISFKRSRIKIVIHSHKSLNLHLLKMLGSLSTKRTTAREMSIRKWIYILPKNLAILWRGWVSSSLSHLSGNWIWNMAQNSNSKFWKLTVMPVLRTTQNVVISRCCFAKNGKEMHQDSQHMCTAILLLNKPFVSSVSVAVAAF